jgi:hypothetical protein
MNWHNVTLGQFQQINEIESRQLSDIDKVLYSICVLYNKTEYELDNTEPVKVRKMMEAVEGLAVLSISKPAKRIGRYFVNYDVSSITFGQYIDIAFFISNNPVKYAHYILASMSKVWGRKYSTDSHRKRAEYFLKQPVSKTMSALGAIRESFDAFNGQYKNLFGVDPEVSGNVQNDEFNRRYGWIFSATQVAAHEGITLEEAYDLSVRRAFNGLAYLKAKGKYEMEQLRKSKPVI